MRAVLFLLAERRHAGRVNNIRCGLDTKLPVAELRAHYGRRPLFATFLSSLNDEPSQRALP